MAAKGFHAKAPRRGGREGKGESGECNDCCTHLNLFKEHIANGEHLSGLIDYRCLFRLRRPGSENLGYPLGYRLKDGCKYFLELLTWR